MTGWICNKKNTNSFIQEIALKNAGCVCKMCPILFRPLYVNKSSEYLTSQSPNRYRLICDTTVQHSHSTVFCDMAVDPQYMCWVKAVRLSCYLVLLSVDSKTMQVARQPHLHDPTHITVWYKTIFHTLKQLQSRYKDQTSNSNQTSHISPMWANSWDQMWVLSNL